ncbi:MAG: molybdopterin-guanine dinucleotide biosynthesis protein MobB [Candidatus Aramenus sulfurataquae]|uniref:Molybdopterin-guanine dinucleotide biosynthesis protein MobB n=1 Tax=Candidatus Aramenus sulfurataquae TaxID=1326980 RepID=W7KPV8_9CREN|nr:MAG: molybdopterin-guanine dinucleotide biosynthesis protein MobB [Candidatus Aramenus sulfurataquae]
MVCIFQVVGKKDAGKTKAIELATKMLTQKGLFIATVKHSHHVINPENKDTSRFMRAGAKVVLFHSNDCAIFFPCFDYLRLLPVDVVIIEGFKDLNLGKKFEITKVEEAEEIARQIVKEAEECAQEVKMEVNGRKAERSFENLIIFNLMRHLNIREVKLVD